MIRVPLDTITLDAELQPRAAIDRSVLDNYVQLLVDGTTFPPVVVFREDETLWLADGFHRWHAHKVLELDGIDIHPLDGSRREALLYSLSANSKHGLQRSNTDYRRAYEIACRNGLVDPTDSDAVAGLLRCTGRWASELTERAREAVRAARDAEIIRLKGAGKSNREVARELEMPRRTVDGVVGGQERKSSETAQYPPVWKQKLDELSSDAAQNWSAALKALRAINEQVSVDDLFADRFVGFDQAFAPELEAAFEWITALHERFGHERDQRRRA